jgi:hypothetical protein
MTIELRAFASGDTDYIARLNANNATLKAAIDALQAQIAAATEAGGAISAGLMINALFNNADALIGPGAYEPSLSGATATIAEGAMYLVEPNVVVSSLFPVDLNFGGQSANTYYIVVGASGIPTFETSADPGAAYSVEWSGVAFVGDPVREAPAFFDTNEAAAARISTALTPEPVGSPPVGASTTEYDTLDDRLEAGEAVAIDALATAETALALAQTARVRKVGVTVTETGVAGAIQVDFYGTIVGWSCIADAVGDLEVEVSIASSSAPPADPTLPDVVTDKISASSPVELSSAQSASSAEAGVSTWDTTVDEWDVIQFNVITLTTLTRATLYLRIEEITSP